MYNYSIQLSYNVDRLTTDDRLSYTHRLIYLLLISLPVSYL